MPLLFRPIPLIGVERSNWGNLEMHASFEEEYKGFSARNVRTFQKLFGINCMPQSLGTQLRQITIPSVFRGLFDDFLYAGSLPQLRVLRTEQMPFTLSLILRISQTNH